MRNVELNELMYHLCVYDIQSLHSTPLEFLMRSKNKVYCIPLKFGRGVLLAILNKKVKRVTPVSPTMWAWLDHKLSY